MESFEIVSINPCEPLLEPISRGYRLAVQWDGSVTRAKRAEVSRVEWIASREEASAYREWFRRKVESELREVQLG